MEENVEIIDVTLASTSGEGPYNDDIVETTEEEQALVNRFLDDEMNFNDFMDIMYNKSLKVDEPEKEIPEKNEGILPVEKEKRKPKEIRQNLPQALKGLMGEANLRLARGDKETAVKICLEIIRQVPTAAEPFVTLAGIYEEMGDQEKYIQMSLLAAHLSPTDLYQWINLAELTEKQGLTKLAISCYSKAINLNLDNIDLHKRRQALLESINDKKTALKGYFRLLCSMKPEKGEAIMSLAKYLAETYHKENDFVKASEALGYAIKKCPNLVNSEFINLQLELLLLLKNYNECIQIMVKFCDIVIESQQVGDTIFIINCQVPSEMPIDIIAKLVIILIHLKATPLVDEIIKPITSSDLGAAGDLYLDIADAFVEECAYEKAIELLRTLVCSEEYSLPGVWLKYAECMKNVGCVEEAVSSYYKVLEQAPQHVEARMVLASLLVELKKSDDAITVLTQNEDYGCLDIGLLYERCMLLKNKDRDRELVCAADLLFSRHTPKIRNKDELGVITSIQRFDKKRACLKAIRKNRKEPEDDMTKAFIKSNKSPSSDEEWDLFKYVCTLCLKLKLYSTFQRLTFSAQLSSVFHVYKTDLDLLSVIAAYLNKDYLKGCNKVRSYILKNLNHVKVWHLFNLLINKNEDTRHNKFIMRLLAKNSDHPALGLLHANNCLVAGTYKYAMHEYSLAYERNPTALGALLLALTYLQLAAQKFTSKKHHLVLQALGVFSQYKERRGIEGLQEVHYNLARGFHHLGLDVSAIYHYKKVLELADHPFINNNPNIFDLSKEAAFNLHLIYCQSESYDLAKMILEKYIIIE